MYVIDQPRPADTPIPGVRHATWAGSRNGLQQLSVWRQTLAAGSATPPHSHDCEEVVMCQGGRGEAHIGGVVHRFTAGQSVLLPAGLLHQLFNTGEEPLELTAVFAATPVPVALPDGSALELPWHS